MAGNCPETGVSELWCGVAQQFRDPPLPLLPAIYLLVGSLPAADRLDDEKRPQG